MTGVHYTFPTTEDHLQGKENRRREEEEESEMESEEESEEEGGGGRADLRCVMSSKPKNRMQPQNGVRYQPLLGGRQDTAVQHHMSMYT